MITLRKRLIYTKDTFEQPRTLIGVELDKKDYGVSFADYLTECDIEGHDIKNVYESMRSGNYTQKCNVCSMERSVQTYPPENRLGADMLYHYIHTPTKYGEWIEPKEICWYCDEGCMINKPLGEARCPTCSTSNITDDDTINGIYHIGKNETVLYDCHVCNTQDQIIQ